MVVDGALGGAPFYPSRRPRSKKATLFPFIISFFYIFLHLTVKLLLEETKTKENTDILEHYIRENTVMCKS